MNNVAYPPSYELLLRIPPFPGLRIPDAALGKREKSACAPDAHAPSAILALLRESRAAGAYWAAQPNLPAESFVLLRPRTPAEADDMVSSAREEGGKKLLLWVSDDFRASRSFEDVLIVKGPCDPWHMLNQAECLWTNDNDETAFIAALLGVPVRLSGSGGRFSILNEPGDDMLITLARRELCDEVSWRDPFTGDLCPVDTIIRYCAAWRQLIDANRPIAAAFGFGQWKQDTVDALLWNGSGDHAPFASAREERLATLHPEAGIALWKARVPDEFLRACEAHGGSLHEVEDGFIRSAGLGADCVPPLSIIVDPVGVHYDPSRPSGLEIMLATADFPPELLRRAAQLRELIVTSGISKYEIGNITLTRPGGERRHILVPGQVEDDRSVLAGRGEVQGNLDLLRRVRATEPEAYILYKPHPDILSGHRKGHVPEAEVLKFADEIAIGQSISALLDMVDGVHVMTSLAGFEALLRDKDVTTHGIPFYAGWDLTQDFGPVPERRGRKRSLDELVAATLLLYPRYLDPVTGLPCPPELLIERLKAGVHRKNPAIVMLRRTQGGLRRFLSGLGFAA